MMGDDERSMWRQKEMMKVRCETIVWSGGVVNYVVNQMVVWWFWRSWNERR